MQLGKYEIDVLRTLELHLPGVLVIAGKGDPSHLFCIHSSSADKPCCPKCGSVRVRNQGNMHRQYLDVVPRGDDIAAITVDLEFRKSKCLSLDCGCVFYPEISFAGPYSRTTRRLEDAIVRMVLEGGYSYSLISEILDGHLSRQVVGQVFHHRVRELEVDTSEEARWFRHLMRDDPPSWVYYTDRGHLWFDILEK